MMGPTALPEIVVTRRYRFSASHRLHSPLLTPEENRRIYGKCNHPYGHGHDYFLDVSVRGPLDQTRGRLVPIDQLDRLVQTVVLDDFAWKNLNSEVAEFATLVPTTENLALVAAERLSAAWHVAFPGAKAVFDRVRIQETRNNIFEAQRRVPASETVEPVISGEMTQ